MITLLKQRIQIIRVAIVHSLAEVKRLLHFAISTITQSKRLTRLPLVEVVLIAVCLMEG